MEYQESLNAALKLANIGKTLTIYKSRQHAFYIALQELNYAFTHEEIALIALLLRSSGSSLMKKSLYQHYKSLLPKKEPMRCLSFIFNLTILLHENTDEADFRFRYAKQTLTIHSDQSLYHAKESVKSLKKPHPFALIIDDRNRVPRYDF
jgi:exopolyphosphatase/guanosine-5'-triphosphate,3'-diphosphate pyrophosphatase